MYNKNEVILGWICLRREGEMRAFRPNDKDKDAEKNKFLYTRDVKYHNIVLI